MQLLGATVSKIDMLWPDPPDARVQCTIAGDGRAVYVELTQYQVDALDEGGHRRSRAGPVRSWRAGASASCGAVTPASARTAPGQGRSRHGVTPSSPLKTGLAPNFSPFSAAWRHLQRGACPFFNGLLGSAESRCEVRCTHAARLRPRRRWLPLPGTDSRQQSGSGMPDRHGTPPKLARQATGVPEGPPGRGSWGMRYPLPGGELSDTSRRTAAHGSRPRTTPGRVTARATPAPANPLQPSAPIRPSVASYSTFPFSTTSRMKKSPSASRSPTNSGVRTSTSTGMVRRMC